jgi:hypothetical protein
MKFGAKEVMVIAALTFGIMAAGCSAAGTTPALEPPLRPMNAGVHECKICFSQYELEFYYPNGFPVREHAEPEKEQVEPWISAPVTGGPGAAGYEYCSEAMSWTLSLPRCFK